MSGGACAAGVGAGIVAFTNLQTEEIDGSSYTLKTNGSIIHTQDTTGNLKWVVNTAPTNYEVRFGGAGSWLDFTADRSISATSLIELRDKYTTAVVKTVTVTLV